MWHIFDLFWVEVILGLLLIVYLSYKYFTRNYGYWKDRSVPYVEPHFPFGTDKDLVFHTLSFSDHYRNLYNKCKDKKMVGCYTINRPYLLLRDPDLIKQVMIKDFSHFVDRSIVDPELLSPVSRTLFDIEGETWRNMRTKLTPAFTSGKMKLMFHLMEACTEEFRKALHVVASQQEGKVVDMKDLVARFTTDVISSCAFGLESNSIKEPDNLFRKNGKKILENPTGINFIKVSLVFFLPKISRFLGIQFDMKEAEDFFRNIVYDTVKYRETSGVVRNDFIDLMIKIRNNKSLADDDQSDTGNEANDGNKEAGLTLDEMTAQAIVFFAAGFETAASTMTFCLYELARNPDVQEKLHKEVEDVLRKHSDKASYQALQEMPYLEAVINETLRRYASLGFLNRKCTEDYKLPDTNVIIPKGMAIVIPTYAIHHDPDYYPNPFKFDPERFMKDGIKTKGNCTFMPFGEGPRMCIGSRFGWLQMKTCLSMIIHDFQISVTEETPSIIIIDKYNFITTPEKPIELKITKRQNI